MRYHCHPLPDSYATMVSLGGGATAISRRFSVEHVTLPAMDLEMALSWRAVLAQVGEASAGIAWRYKSWNWIELDGK